MKLSLFAALLLAALAALAAGCADAAPGSAAPGAVGAGSASPGSAVPGGAPAAGLPFAIDRLTESFEGTAREVLQVSGYTYVAVDVVESGQASTRWAVTLHRDLSEGARVRVRAFGKKRAFESRKLGRTFDELWFAIVTPATPVTPVTSVAPVTPEEEEEEGARS